MPKVAKIITAAVLIVVGLASMGLIWLRDSSSRPEYCAQCHAVMDPYYSSWESSDYLAHKHAEFAIPCQICHSRTISDTLREIVTYARGEYKTPLEEQKHPKEECLQCHEHGSYAELIQRTKDYTVGGQKVNPHASEKGEIECSSCHSMHKESPGITGQTASTAAAISKDVCLGCHGPFDKVVSATADYTMPNGEKANPHRYVPHDSKDIPECSYCHVPHPVPLTSTEGLPKPSVQYCYGCHHAGVLQCGTCH